MAGHHPRLRPSIPGCDRDPEAGPEIQFHPAHEVTSEAAKVSHLGGILRLHDEPKLMAISPAALHKRLAISLVLESGVGLAPLAVTGDPVPFKVTEMSVHGSAHRPAHLRTRRAPLEQTVSIGTAEMLDRR